MYPVLWPAEPSDWKRLTVTEILAQLRDIEEDSGEENSDNLSETESDRGSGTNDMVDQLYSTDDESVDVSDNESHGVKKKLPDKYRMMKWFLTRQFGL